VEFAVDILTDRPRPKYNFHLLQCRPLKSLEWGETLQLPADVPEADKLFSAHKLVPQGVVSNIDYIIYIDPEAYGRIAERSVKLEIGRIVGRLNNRLERERFILMGPGRWGTSNIDLGVKVTYADIFNTRVLVEIAMGKDGETPEVSYGTHFFQDLVESRIYPLPLYPCEEGVIFNQALLDGAPNALPELLPDDAAYVDCVKVIDVKSVSGGRFLEIVMDGEQDQALAYLTAHSKMTAGREVI
jgi:pyruvate,water dikinase